MTGPALMTGPAVESPVSAGTPAGTRATRTHAHEGLTDRLNRTLAGRARKAHTDATIASTDLFYEYGANRSAHWRAEGAIAVEMEASALFAVGASAGIQVACLLAVSDTFDAEGTRTRIDDHALVEAVEAMGTVAAAALVM